MFMVTVKNLGDKLKEKNFSEAALTATFRKLQD
jgi:hypothetical protein